MLTSNIKNFIKFSRIHQRLRAQEYFLDCRKKNEIVPKNRLILIKTRPTLPGQREVLQQPLSGFADLSVARATLWFCFFTIDQ